MIVAVDPALSDWAADNDALLVASQIAQCDRSVVMAVGARIVRLVA